MKIPKIDGAEIPSPRSEMKQWLIDFIREMNLNTGDVVPMRPLMTRVIRLNPIKKEALGPAFEELEKEGLLEKRGESYFLTKHGRDSVY